MSSALPELLIRQCRGCQHRFAPREGPCPRCGSGDTTSQAVPPIGRVMAATESMVPPPGWPTPHRLALVELADEVRVLVVVDGETPHVGDEVPLHLDGPIYRSSRPSHERGSAPPQEARSRRSP